MNRIHAKWSRSHTSLLQLHPKNQISNACIAHSHVTCLFSLYSDLLWVLSLIPLILATCDTNRKGKNTETRSNPKHLRSVQKLTIFIYSNVSALNVCHSEIGVDRHICCYYIRYHRLSFSPPKNLNALLNANYIRKILQFRTESNAGLSINDDSEKKKTKHTKHQKYIIFRTHRKTYQ